MLENDGIEVRKNLIISPNAHTVQLNHIEEDKRNSLGIGTTGRGIGPCYKAKAERTGIRVCDIKPIYIDNIRQKGWNEYADSLEFLLTLQIGPARGYLNDPKTEILAEGAQGVLLDIDHGTYPFVTSSNTTIGGVMTGLGVSHKNIRKVYGVFKAYMTRVGNGPFTTELNNEIGENIRKIGGEFGATTGRPRRCGWLDIPALRYACEINGVTDLVMTKADVLNDFGTVRACIGYNYFDMDYKEEFSYYHYSNKVHDDMAEPIYVDFMGWNTDTNKEPLEQYIQYIEKEVGVPVTMVSIGRDRNNIYQR